MGLPLHNIHSPTVGSSLSNKSDQQKDDVPILDLMRQKDDLEAEMTALGSVLESHRANMSTSLLTFDGFPRSDIDVAQIRTTRARIIHLQNDHKALLARIEPKLHEYFAAQREISSANLPSQPAPAQSAASSISTSRLPPTTAPAQPQNTASSSVSSSHQLLPQESHAATPVTLPAFARINTVTPSSPAETAGLLPGDRIQRFGDADWSNHDKLARVARIVGQNEGRDILVTVVRSTDGQGERQVSVTLVPRSGWGGRGSLGCHLIPL